MADLAAGNAARDAPFKNEYKRGNVEELIEKAKKGEDGLKVVEGTVEMGTQKHFYLENQSCYAYEDEDGVMVAFSGLQWPAACQAQVIHVYFIIL